MALSDTQQAFIMLAALILIAVGAVTLTVPSQIPAPLNQYIGLCLMIIGAIGAAMKEWLGIQQTPAPQPAPAAAKFAEKLVSFSMRFNALRHRTIYLQYVK
jgi:hypothetical protein